MKILSILAAVMACLLVPYSGFELVKQWRLVHYAMPVEATVESSRVNSHYSGHFTEYSPLVEYRYRVGGKWYRSSEVFPASQNGRHAWAEAITDRFPAGARVTAYYDAEHPDRAFLVAGYSFTPHIGILLGTLFLAMAPFFFLTNRNKEARTAPVQSVAGYVLPAAWNWRILGPLLVGFGMLMLAGTAWSLWDFYRAASPPYGWLDIAYTVAMPLASLAAAGGGLYVMIGGRGLSEAALRVNRWPLRAGDRVVFTFEQAFHRPGLLRWITMQLACREQHFQFLGMHGHLEETDLFVQRLDLTGDRAVSAGETIAEDFEVCLPPGCPPSTPIRCWVGPKHYWRIEVKTKLAGRLEYVQQFFFRVE